MHRSLIFPVGSSDIDGPDFIILPWGEEIQNRFRRRAQAAKRLAANDEFLSCLRFRAADGLGFFTPAEDGEWQERLESIHVENSVLPCQRTPRFFLRRWEGFRVKMPDPPRISFYPDGTVFLSGPIGLSSTRWETSCGLRLGPRGAMESVPKNQGG